MGITSLLSVCISALIVVFIVLGILAFLMRCIIYLFPEKEKEEDPLYLAAITSAINVNYPGMKITGIREEK